MFSDKTLIIVRHGNTFRTGEEPRRVGARTDLPLVEELRSVMAARIIKSRCLLPTQVFAAPLLRTMQTAELIVREIGVSCPIRAASDFTEVDYGVDEGQTEEAVMRRLGIFYLGNNTEPDLIIQRGKEEIERWNIDGTVPAGWNVDVDKIIASWRKFASEIGGGETVLVVSSNGIIRFAPYILEPDNLELFRKTHNLKVTTAGISIFVQKNNSWNITDWNIKPIEENIHVF
jgi:probable phosphoglycerate mutase